MVAPTIGAILNDRSNFKLFYPCQVLNPYSKYISILKKCTCAVDTVIVVQSLLAAYYFFSLTGCPVIHVCVLIQQSNFSGSKDHRCMTVAWYQTRLNKCACFMYSFSVPSVAGNLQVVYQGWQKQPGDGLVKLSTIPKITGTQASRGVWGHAPPGNF